MYFVVVHAGNGKPDGVRANVPYPVFLTPFANADAISSFFTLQ